MVDINEKQSFVRNIYVGSVSYIICINVRQSPTQNCIIIWDIDQDREIRSFDVSNNAKVIYDSKGDPYIIDGNTFINCRQNVTLKAYGGIE